MKIAKNMILFPLMHVHAICKELILKIFYRVWCSGAGVGNYLKGQDFNMSSILKGMQNRAFALQILSSDTCFVRSDLMNVCSVGKAGERALFVFGTRV